MLLYRRQICCLHPTNHTCTHTYTHQLASHTPHLHAHTSTPVGNLHTTPVRTHTYLLASHTYTHTPTHTCWHPTHHSCMYALTHTCWHLTHNTRYHTRSFLLSIVCFSNHCWNGDILNVSTLVRITHYVGILNPVYTLKVLNLKSTMKLHLCNSNISF